LDISENRDLELTQVLDLFWGVVVPTEIHIDIRWSRAQRIWQYRRSSYFPYEAAVGPYAEPNDEVVRQLLELGSRFDQGRPCRHCYLSDPGMHGVAPDVFGDLRVYCLLRPSPSVVASGAGRMKHAGEGLGCHAITPRWFRCEDSGRRLAAYGHVLDTASVLSMAWCGRCQSIAASRSASTPGSYEVLQVHLAPT
jgi:hypothetical protein